MKRFFFTLILVCAPLATNVEAQQSGCAEALVKATYNRISTSHLDWRLASFVSEYEYNEIKHDAGANAVIYGVPVGASYSDYQQRVTDIQKSYNESLTVDQATNIMWTGLDPSAANAYSECLKAKIFSLPGLHIGVKSATKKEVSILIVWTPVGKAGDATPSWQWKGAEGAKLPKTVVPGTRIVVLPRPVDQQILAGNFGGYSDALTVEPYPTLPAPSKTHLEQSVETYRSIGITGWGKYFTPAYTFCTPDKPVGWTVVRLVDFHLEGERSCGAYSTCGGGEADTGTRICRAFTVQGRENGENGGYASANGVMTVIWSHPEPNINGIQLVSKYNAIIMRRAVVATAPKK